MVTRGKDGKGGGIVGEFGIDMYTLLYLKWVINRDLLYSTGNSAQYSVMAYMGKESKKRVDICICITDSDLKLTQDCKSTILQ